MEYVGFVAMNCQFHALTGMSDLCHLLIKSCQELRIHEPITFNAHCFLVYLIDKFINLTAVTIKTVSETINNQQSIEGVSEFLPPNFDALYKICLELNDGGHILLLKDRIAIEKSYIVIDKEFLLSGYHRISPPPEVRNGNLVQSIDPKIPQCLGDAALTSPDILESIQFLQCPQWMHCLQ